MKLIVTSIVCLLIGGGAGVGAGVFMKPEVDIEREVNEKEVDGEPSEPEPKEQDVGVEYTDMGNQFIVPLITDGQIESIVVLSIGLEILEGTLAEVHRNEPKLRAAFLQVFFNHSNNGGFSGNFTSFSTMDVLKRELNSVAQSILPDVVIDVLVLDVIRQ